MRDNMCMSNITAQQIEAVQNAASFKADDVEVEVKLHPNGCAIALFDDDTVCVIAPDGAYVDPSSDPDLYRELNSNN